MTRSYRSPTPHLAGEFHALVESQVEILTAMIQPNGAVLASPNGGYKAHWVRDGLYVLAAAACLGLSDLGHRLIRAPFSIFQKHRRKIQSGIQHRPGSNFEYLHARYHPTHFEEFEAEWGHNQLDMLGLFLYLVAHLPAKGIDVFQYGRQYEDRILLSHITRYLETLEWWRCADYGVWEEGPKLNASSIGAVLAGLSGLKSLDDPDLYFNERQLARGRDALDRLLPAESEGRPCDLAQLSLIWPFGVLDEAQTSAVLDNVETRLVRERGVIRYEGDGYFNAADDRLVPIHDPRTGRELLDYGDQDRQAFPFTVVGLEAQWPLGLAWLSIVYSKRAKRRFAAGKDHGAEKARAAGYLERLTACALPVDGVTPGYFPELYVGERPNINAPLTWTTAFAIVAAVVFAEIEDPGVRYSLL